MPTLKKIMSEAEGLLQRGDTQIATALFKKVLVALPGEPIALEYLGVQAAKSGDHVEAIALFNEARRHPRCRASVYFQLGHALRDCGRLEDAAESYKRYIESENIPSGAVSLADVYFKLGRIQDAETVLLQALEWQPGHIKALCLLACACDALGRGDDARVHRKNALNSQDSSDEALLLKSCALLDLGEPHQAFASISKVANSLYGTALDEVCDRFNKEDAVANLPPLQGVSPAPANRPLIVAVGDPAYVERYAPNLIRSVQEKSPETEIHVHVVSPEPAVGPPDLGGDLPAFSMSWECDTNADRTTFATRRFVRLAQWRQYLEQTIVVIDIDSLIRNEITIALETLPEFDVAMRYRTEEVFFRQRVAAGFIAIASTKEAQQFSNAVAAYILHFERAGKAKWFIDQMALLAVRCRYLEAKSVSPIRIVNIPDHFLDWRHHATDSVVWTAKGVHKALPVVG